MSKDLIGFINWLEQDSPTSILRVKEPIDTKYEITALQYALGAQGKYPVILCEKPINADGRIGDIPIVVNLMASRDILCKLMGISSPKRAAIEYSKKMGQTRDPIVVSSQEAPVKEVIEKGDQIDLFKFPHTLQHEMNVGRYITAGSLVTYDPDTGIDNSALMRCWVKKKNQTGVVASPTTHTLKNIEKFFSRGQDVPVAIWIGHHPGALIGGQSKLGYPESHYPAMGGMLDESLRLVPTETHGNKILVPADAEIVIEGYIPCDVYVAEGPFAEYTGYVGPQIPARIIEVTCVTHRKNAIYHDYGVGLPDMLVLDNMAIEAKIYNIVKSVIPELQNVHVPLSGKRFHAYLQIDKTRPGIGKDAILAALPCYPRLKHIFAVDKDIDIFDDRQVLWAVATRTQWDKDVYILPGGTVSPLDPSVPSPGTVGCNGGIDATLPPPIAPGLPNYFQAVNKVPDEVMKEFQLNRFVDKGSIACMPETF